MYNKFGDFSSCSDNASVCLWGAGTTQRDEDQTFGLFWELEMVLLLKTGRNNVFFSSETVFKKLSFSSFKE